jgi:uncharacterized SAM-binding protein YcdF (DUF218 family)
MNKKRILKALLIAVAAVFAIQALYFASVMAVRNTTAPSEAVVVFRGTQKRIETGYALAASGMAPKMILSPATDAARRRYDRKYGLPNGVAHLAEPAARTTLENAYYTAQLIRAGNLRSVTLVTSNYHMPRSLLLLRLFLAGKGVCVAGYKVSAVKEGARPPDGYRATFAKLVYNEMLKFWGSLAEYVAWQISGEEMERFRDRFPAISALRSWLLMDVSPSW